MKTANQSKQNKKFSKSSRHQSKNTKKQLSHHRVATSASSPSSSSSVYKRTPSLPLTCPMEFQLHEKRFLTPHDTQYNQVMKTCYKDFQIQSDDTFHSSFHDRFYSAMQGLESQYQFDYTQPAGLGTKVVRTYVTRCLVGDPGITYKYLGLRMFGIPWTENTVGSSNSSIEIGKLNKELIKRTKTLLSSSGKDSFGSCEYNLTLINKCFSRDDDSVRLKDEPMFGGKCAVSWHADSSLQHYSSIAVYHCTHDNPPDNTYNQDPKNNQDPTDNSLWRILLRQAHNSEGPQSGKPYAPIDNPAPPVAIPLPSRYAYFLLDEFNHNNQHAVMAGSTARYASTHRVSREDGHTYETVRTRCQSSLQSAGQSARQIRKEQLALSDVEFEFIRQFYIQGSAHCKRHIWWADPIKVLLDLWGQLEQRTKNTYEALRDAVLGFDKDDNELSLLLKSGADKNEVNRLRKHIDKRKKRVESVERQSYIELQEALSERLLKRRGWLDREKDGVFAKAPENARPMKVPFPVMELKPEEMEKMLENLRKFQNSFNLK